MHILNWMKEIVKLNFKYKPECIAEISINFASEKV